MDPVQDNKNPNPNIDTSVSDGSALPFPVGDNQGAAPTPPTTGTASPQTPPAADVTGANQPALNETPPPPPANGTVVTAIKPTRGKFGPTGLIATIFGVLLLIGATLGGVLLVQQNQDIREKAAGNLCSDYADCTASSDATHTVSTTCKNADGTDSVVFCPAPAAPAEIPCDPACGANFECDTNTGTCKQRSASGCSVYFRYSCPNATDFSGGCQQNKEGPLSSNPGYIPNYCGIQQIDCCVGDTSQTCNSAFVSSTGPTGTGCATPPPTQPKSNVCQDTCIDQGKTTCDFNPNDTNCRPVTDCGGVGLESAPGDCSNGAFCCRPKTPAKPACRAVSVNRYKKGSGDWITIGRTEVVNDILKTLTAGDQITFVIQGGGIDGTAFNRARVIINGGTPIETARYSDVTRPIGTNRKFVVDYTIPEGTTTFDIVGQVRSGGTWY